MVLEICIITKTHARACLADSTKALGGCGMVKKKIKRKKQENGNVKKKGKKKEKVGVGAVYKARLQMIQERGKN